MTNQLKIRYAVASALLLALAGPPAAPMARSPNPLQALKGALDAAASQAKQPAAQQSRPAPGGPAARATASSGDCCSAEAMKKTAAALSGVDIAGIRLGMSPEQAFAAVQAFNPKMVVQTNKSTFYDMPSDSPTRQIPAPWYAVAHTPGSSASTFMAGDNSSDQILIEFSTPPSAPMVVRVIRYVSFPNGEPLVSATLSDSLVKKYGPITEHGPGLVWVYDGQGKHVGGGAPTVCSSAGNAFDEAPAQPPYSPGTITHTALVPQQEFASQEIDRTNSHYFLKSCHNLGAVVVARPGDDMGRDF
ncbi:MAG TPA: hypothetical protein VFN88_07825, partial [Caulobacteraceae bacterium]|nr:hypothetical protein [Caulobacteraceae bacterium]